MTPTCNLRHVWRTVSEGNGEIRLLALQQWWEAEGWENDDTLAAGGEWQDVEISRNESSDAPSS